MCGARRRNLFILSALVCLKCFIYPNSLTDPPEQQLLMNLSATPHQTPETINLIDYYTESPICEETDLLLLQSAAVTWFHGSQAVPLLDFPSKP